MFFSYAISNVHKRVIVINSIETRFSRKVFEVVQQTRWSCFIKNTPARLLNIKLTLFRTEPMTSHWLLLDTIII